MRTAAAPLIYLFGDLDAGLKLRVLSETDTTITLGWDPLPVNGFRFTREKAPLHTYSHTWDGKRTSVRFSKDSAWYSVEAIEFTDSDIWP
jgi:hypothetical protein